MGESSGQASARMPDDSGQSAVAPDNGVTPLMKACQAENVKDVKRLIEQGDDVSERDISGRTALHYCVDNTSSQVADLLITSDQTLLTSADSDGLTPLHLVVMAGNAVLVRFLLQRGASVTVVDGEGRGIVHWAIVCKHVELIYALCASGADVDQPDVYQAAPLHYAAQLAGTEPKLGMRAIAKLLSRKTSVECRDNQQRTPLLWAASAGCADACAVLLKAGANVEAADKDGLTAMHCAASRGHVTCVAMVLRRGGAEVDSLDKYGCTPLFYAITLDHVDCVRFLLDKLANPNHQDNRGRSPAHCAAAKGSCTSLKLLKQKKCNLWVASNKGEYPIHEAALASHTAAVRFLLNENKQQVNVANQDGRTCLHIAALTNNLDLCRLLVAGFHADRNLVMTSRGEGLTPYDAAVMKGSRECAEYLRQNGGISLARNRWLAEHGYTASDGDVTDHLLSYGDSDDDLDTDDVDGISLKRGTASARARKREERRKQIECDIGAVNEDINGYEFGQSQGHSKNMSLKQKKLGDDKTATKGGARKSREGAAGDAWDDDDQPGPSRRDRHADEDCEISADINNPSSAAHADRRRLRAGPGDELDDERHPNKLARGDETGVGADANMSGDDVDGVGQNGIGTNVAGGGGGAKFRGSTDLGAGGEGTAGVRLNVEGEADGGVDAGDTADAKRGKGEGAGSRADGIADTGADVEGSEACTGDISGFAMNQNSTKSGAAGGTELEQCDSLRQTSGVNESFEVAKESTLRLNKKSNRMHHLGLDGDAGAQRSENESDTDSDNLETNKRNKNGNCDHVDGEYSDSDEAYNNDDDTPSADEKRRRRARGKGVHGDDNIDLNADGNGVDLLLENNALDQSNLTASQVLARARDAAAKGEDYEEEGDVKGSDVTLTNAQGNTADNTLDDDDVDLPMALSKQQKRSNIRWVFFDTEVDKGTQTEDWLIKFSRALAVGLTPDDPVCADRDKLPLSYAERDTLLMKLGDRGLGGRERRASKASCTTSEATYVGPESVKGASDAALTQDHHLNESFPAGRSAYEFGDVCTKANAADAENAANGARLQVLQKEASSDGKDSSTIDNLDDNHLGNNLSSASGNSNQMIAHHQQVSDGRDERCGHTEHADGRYGDMSNTMATQKSLRHPHRESTIEQHTSSRHADDPSCRAGSESTSSNTVPVSGIYTAETLSLNEGDDDVFTPRRCSTPHDQDDTPHDQDERAIPVTVVVEDNSQCVQPDSSFQTVHGGESTQAAVEQSANLKTGNNQNDRVHSHELSFTSSQVTENSAGLAPLGEELNGGAPNKRYFLTKQQTDSENVVLNKLGGVKTNQGELNSISERKSTFEDPHNVKRYKLLRNEVLKTGTRSRTCSTGEKQGVDLLKEHAATASRKSSISKETLDKTLYNNQQNLYSNQLGEKIENSPLVAKLESIIAKVPELMADSGTNPEQPDGCAPTELKAIAHSKRATFLRMIVSHGYDRILPSSRTPFKPSRPILHYRPGGGVGTEASDHLQHVKHRKDKSCQTPAYLDRLPRPRSAQPRRSPPIIQLPQRPSTAPLTRKALRRKDHDQLMKLYRMFGLERRMRSNSTTSTLATSVVSKRPPRAVKLIPAKKCQNEIQELVRIFENKRLTSKEMFHARQLKMKNQYATKKASDKLLVKRLVTDYNCNSIYDRHSTAEFEKVVDFQTVLLGKLHQTLLDEKVMHEGRWVPDNSKLPTIGQRMKEVSKQSKSITPSPPPNGAKLNGCVSGTTNSRSNMRVLDTTPSSADVIKGGSLERKPQLPRLTLIKPLLASNTKAQLVAHKPPISAIGVSNRRTPVSVRPQR